MFGLKGSLSVGCILCVGVAMASPILPTSYDMPNGDGVISGGSFNYWDLNYTGTGNTSLDNDPLSGGLGDLTDGVIASGNWSAVENVEGTGPYVGWRAGLNGNPQITFHFDPGSTIETVTVYVDDANGDGGVDLPDSVIINGVTFDIDQFLAGAEPKSFTFSNLGFVGDTMTIDLIASSEWVFASEITFDSQPVPEPMTLAVLGAGAVALVRKRKRK